MKKNITFLNDLGKPSKAVDNAASKIVAAYAKHKNIFQFANDLRTIKPIKPTVNWCYDKHGNVKTIYPFTY